MRRSVAAWLLCGTLVVAGTPALGADWRLVTVGNDRNFMGVDLASVETVEGGRRAWVLNQYTKTRAEAEGTAYDLSFMEFNCLGEKVRHLSGTLYSPAGEVVSRLRADPDFVTIPPRTVIAAVMRVVCGTEKASPNAYDTSEEFRQATIRTIEERRLYKDPPK
jgi:hypothetical protein